MTGKAGLGNGMRSSASETGEEAGAAGTGGGDGQQVVDPGETPVLQGQAERQTGEQQRRRAKPSIHR